MELTDNDRQRIEQEAEQRYSNDDFRRYDFKRGAEYEHKYQREQQAELRNKVINECVDALFDAGFDPTLADYSKIMFGTLNSLKK